MKAKEYLQQIRKLDKMIENKLIEKKQWQEIATGTTSRMDGERVQSSGSQQKMADAIDRALDIDAEIKLHIESLFRTKKDILSVIEQLNATEYDVLHKVYVQHLTLQEVADSYQNSYSWATTIHGHAIAHVQKILDGRKAESKNVLAVTRKRKKV